MVGFDYTPSIKMPLDHYISQVHLKRFYAPSLDSKKLFAFRKSDGFQFFCGSADVCRMSDGSTNTYLTEPRLIEEFLKIIEPKYNKACAELQDEQITPDTIFVLAGFVAFVMACSPTANRLSVASLRDKLAIEAKILDQAGMIPPAPPELGGKTLTDLLAEGTLTYEIDGKYPQAVGINNIIQTITHYGNFHWDIILNEQMDTPFLTSDFPIVVEFGSDPRLVNRVVPLTPSLAIRICPRVELSGKKLGPTFEHFSYRLYRPRRSEIIALNRAIVRCAESLVFSALDAPWLASFIKKNSDFEIAIETSEFPDGTGILSFAQTVIRKTARR